MKKYIYILLLVVLSPFGLTSCLNASDYIDTQGPSIVIYSPVSTTQVKGGEFLFVEMVLEDNQALGSYNIDIHSDSDGHSHDNHIIESFLGDIHQDQDHDHDHLEPFSFNRTWDNILAKGSVVVKHSEIQIPLEAQPGQYHFVVKVLDQVGNQSMMASSFFIVEHE